MAQGGVASRAEATERGYPISAEAWQRAAGSERPTEGPKQTKGLGRTSKVDDPACVQEAGVVVNANTQEISDHMSSRCARQAEGRVGPHLYHCPPCHVSPIC